MWRRNTKSIIIKIILLVLSLVLIAGLALAVKTVRGREEAQDAELMELYNQQQAQQQQARQDSLEEIQKAYEQDMATLERYLPGIVCWGDMLTGGTAGGVSYPTELQTLINKNVCDLYDFRSTVKNADDFNNRVNWDEYVMEIPVVNMGTGRESADTVLGRSGAIPYVTASDIVIPADCEGVALTLRSAEGATVWPLSESDIGVNDVTIAGIGGTLSTAAGFTLQEPKYIFTRTEAGDETAVPAGEPIVTSGSGLYRDYIPVIFVGSFDGEESPETLVEKISVLLAQQEDPSRYVVIGTYYKGSVNRGQLLTSTAAAELESAMSQAFGEHYINLRKYLVNECLNDLSMKPTGTDNNNMTKGTVPASLLSKENGIELIPSAYKCLGRLVYDRLVSLGYLDEVVEELGITNFGRSDRNAK